MKEPKSLVNGTRRFIILIRDIKLQETGILVRFYVKSPLTKVKGTDTVKITKKILKPELAVVADVCVSYNLSLTMMVVITSRLMGKL